MRQAYDRWKAGADPIEFAKEHKEFARTFEPFPNDADQLFPGLRKKLGVSRTTVANLPPDNAVQVLRRMEMSYIGG